MSRKQTVKARPNKKAELERKRDEKAVRRALAKERKNRAQGGGSSDDEEFVSFTNQLQAMGLKIREVPGDGNCLFRALGDQLEGHSRNHLKHRQETVDFMLNHREDFEPFVEDDVPFERHVANLRKPGTFAGNDAIVAFARNNRANVVIHQLNAPLWQICGLDKPDARELHIAYRYGEHYDSVRRISDNSEAPASLKTEMFSKDESNKKGKNKLQNYQVEEIADFEEELTDEVADAIQKVCNATGCTDNDLITQNLEAENYDIESTILAVLQVTELKHFNRTARGYRQQGRSLGTVAHCQQARNSNNGQQDAACTHLMSAWARRTEEEVEIRDNLLRRLIRQQRVMMRQQAQLVRLGTRTVELLEELVRGQWLPAAEQ